MKRLIALALAVIILMPALAHARVAGSKSSRKYHHADCAWVKKIRPENLVQFSTPEEAQAAGYVPCKTCHPAAEAPVQQEPQEPDPLTRR